MEEEVVKKIVERITLKVFRVGCDKDNYKLIMMLPSNLKELAKEFELTKMPMNKRVNELEDVGLLQRFRGTGEVKPTRLTITFIGLIEEIKPKVEKLLPDIV